MRKKNFPPKHLHHIVEAQRPLSPTTVARLERKASEIEGFLEMLKTVPTAGSVLKLAGLLDFLVETIPPTPWVGYVVDGLVASAMNSESSAQDVFRTICLAAGGVLLRPESEYFRLTLSVVTKASLRPPKGDSAYHRAPSHIVEAVDATVIGWSNLISVGDKASPVARALLRGLALAVARGEITVTEARRVVTEMPWRREQNPFNAELG